MSCLVERIQASQESKDVLDERRLERVIALLVLRALPSQARLLRLHEF